MTPIRKKKEKIIKEKPLFSFPEKRKKIFRPINLFHKPGTKYKLSCGAVIYHVDKGEPYYLILKYPRYWGFVKGEVEPGETEEQTLFREAGEEAGLYDLNIIFGFRETQHYFYQFQGELIRKDAVYFIAETNSWKIKISHEHEDYKWVTYPQALSMMKVRANRELLTKVHLFLHEYFKQKKLY